MNHMSTPLSRRGFVAGAAALATAAVAGSTSLAQADPSPVHEPTISVPSSVTETLECDLVICGAGAAGMWAGVEAARNGVKVIIIEKGADLNVSNAAMAGGPMAVGTAQQLEADPGFTVEVAFNDIMDYAHWSINAPLVKAALEISGDTVDTWINDFGIQMELGPDAYNVGHRVRLTFGTPDRFKPMAEEIESNGGQLLFSTPMTALVQDEQGTVTGVYATDESGDPIQINAKATLVCTGGFQGNDTMMREKFGTQVLPLGNVLSIGTGYDAMVAAGAASGTHWGILGNEFAGSNAKDPWNFSMFNNPFSALAIKGGLYVNRDGRRFTNEGKYAEFPLAIGGAISLEIGGPFYGIYGQETIADAVANNEGAEDMLQSALDKGWAFTAETIEDLAEILGMDDLPQTLETYNGYCEAGIDEQFYKTPELLIAQQTGPFYAFEYQPSCWATEGGVKTDDRLRVIDTNGKPIEGLYCAGVDNASILMAPYHRYEGTSLAMCFNTGRLAGRYIAEALA